MRPLYFEIAHVMTRVTRGHLYELHSTLIVLYMINVIEKADETWPSHACVDQSRRRWSLALREHLHCRRLDDSRGALTLLPRQRSSNSEADTRPRLDHLLSPQPPRPRDPHTLRQRLVHDILQQALLNRNVERRRVSGLRTRRVRRLCSHSRNGGAECERMEVCCDRGGVAQVDVDDGRGCVRGYRDAVDALEDRADGTDVLL